MSRQLQNASANECKTIGVQIDAVAAACKLTKRVERLCRSIASRRVAAGDVGGDETHLLARIFKLGGLIEKMGVFEIFGDALQNGKRLVEVDLDDDGGGGDSWRQAIERPQPTGIGIFESSLPMHLRIIDQRLIEHWS